MSGAHQECPSGIHHHLPIDTLDGLNLRKRDVTSDHIPCEFNQIFMNGCGQIYLLIPVGHCYDYSWESAALTITLLGNNFTLRMFAIRCKV